MMLKGVKKKGATLKLIKKISRFCLFRKIYDNQHVAGYGLRVKLPRNPYTATHQQSTINRKSIT